MCKGRERNKCRGKMWERKDIRMKEINEEKEIQKRSKRWQLKRGKEKKYFLLYNKNLDTIVDQTSNSHFIHFLNSKTQAVYLWKWQFS